MIWDSIVAAYYALAVILALASIVGLVVVAVLDSSRPVARRVATQH